MADPLRRPSRSASPGRNPKTSAFKRIGYSGRFWCDSPMASQALRFGLGLAFVLFLTSLAHADALDDAVRREMDRGGIPGLSLAVVKDGQVVSVRNYGHTGEDFLPP